ncbi:hypothetical protein DSO57_1006319 [Entomophthora muscae]|uniref:Uncharacterized protein n=1 Tax=Entomophthora muscae TaxID=34485 RepID=A0ACC2T7J9_9FUNG|nr:hypothetical protein DSO57_1006319 [Entomophthora muscae]
MIDCPTAPPLPDAPPTQDFSKLGFVYITVLGLANQAVLHTGSWRPLATALNYLVCIAPIVYMAFQARPASPVGVQPDSSMGCENINNKDLSSRPQNFDASLVRAPVGPEVSKDSYNNKYDGGRTIVKFLFIFSLKFFRMCNSVCLVG